MKTSVSEAVNRFVQFAVAKSQSPSATCQASVRVQATQKPSCEIYVDKSIVEKGESAKLWWSSANATSATLYSSDSSIQGPVALNGLQEPQADPDRSEEHHGHECERAKTYCAFVNSHDTIVLS